MAGFLPNEGEHKIGQILFQTANTTLILFTNSAPDETITYGTLVQPTGGGYAPITLAYGSWSGGADVFSYATQTFTAVSTDFTPAIYGYAIVTTDATPIILSCYIDPNGPYTITAGLSYDITPSVTIA